MVLALIGATIAFFLVRFFVSLVVPRAMLYNAGGAVAAVLFLARLLVENRTVRRPATGGSRSGPSGANSCSNSGAGQARCLRAARTALIRAGETASGRD